MNALIVYCHPEPGSLNAALKSVAQEELERQGHAVEVSDLYAEGFDPVESPAHYPRRQRPDYFSVLTEQRSASDQKRLPSEVEREIVRLERADLVILQFPLWWHAQPAMLKGWFDRIFVYGGLYTGKRRYDTGHFQGRRAICSVTTGAPAPAFGPGGRGGDIERLMWPIHYSLYYMGFTVLPPFLSHGIQGGGLSYQAETGFQAHLDRLKQDWAKRLAQLGCDEPLRFNGWADWNEDGSACSTTDHQGLIEHPTIEAGAAP